MALCLMIIGCSTYRTKSEFLRAQDDMLSGQYETATSKLQAVLNSTDTPPDVRHQAAVYLFQAYFLLKDYAQCARIYEKHLEGKATPQQRISAILAYYQTGEYDKALKHIRIAKAHLEADNKSESERLLDFEARIQATRGNYANVVDTFKTLHKLTGDQNYLNTIDLIENHRNSRNAKHSPIIWYRPSYPRRALVRGIEGRVTVGFDVNASGETENISVAEAEPSGYFEKAAMKAVAKFRYMPLAQQDEPVDRKDMMHTFHFSIPDTSDEKP